MKKFLGVCKWWIISIVIMMFVSGLKTKNQELKYTLADKENLLSRRRQALTKLKKYPVNELDDESQILHFYDIVRKMSYDLMGANNVIISDPKRKPKGEFVIYQFTIRINEPFWDEVKTLIFTLTKNKGVRFVSVKYSKERWYLVFDYITKRTTPKGGERKWTRKKL